MTSNLYIKVDYPNTAPPTDDGTRPYGGANPIWNNASIWLEGEGSPTPSQTSTTVDHPTNVKVRVTNRGDADPGDPVHVQAWVLNPFTGPFDPEHALPDALFTGFIQGISHGSDGGVTGSSTNVVLCKVGGSPWRPTQADLDTQGGHLCLVANVYDDNEGGPIASGADLHGPVGTDPHVGQRNIALLPAVTPHLHFNVMPGADQEEVALDIQRVSAANIGRGEQWLMRSRANIAYVADDSGRKRFVMAARGRDAAVPLSFSRKAIVGQIAVGNVAAADLRDLSRLSRDFHSGAERMVVNGFHPRQFVVRPTAAPLAATIQVERSDDPGSIQAFDIVQRDAAGQVMGGLRVISIAPR
jgi:hypothetical protein